MIKIEKEYQLLKDLSFTRVSTTKEEEKAADKSFKDILGIAASAIVLAASIAGFITALILR